MTQPKVTICTVHYSAQGGYDLKPHIAPFFSSLAAQTYTNVEVFCLDNASTDEGAKEMLRAQPGVTTFFLDANRGTCAYNEILSRVTGKYLWIVTMDTRFAPDFLEQLVREAEARPEGAAFSGALLSLRGENQTPVIDTLGIGVNAFLSVWDRDQGKAYRQETYAPVEEVFGISGATTLFRMEALRSVLLREGWVWDERFFMYYEDVDLAFRLQWQGWKAFVVHAARGWHVRTLAEKQVPGGKIARVLAGRLGKSPFYQYHTARNKVLLLLRNWNRDLHWSIHLRTTLELLGRLAFLLLFEPASRQGVRDAWRQRRDLEAPKYRPDRASAALRLEGLLS